MALGETAELAVLLRLNDQLSAPLKGVQSELKGMGAAVGSGSSGIVGGLGKAERAAGKFGSAMSHAKNEIGGLVSGPLGFIGVSAGLLSIGGLFEKSIGKATEWGLAIEKLQGLTGETAQSLSGLLAVTEKYGISNERFAMIAGFTEKTLGKLAANGKLSGKILEDYGFQVRNANGTVKTFGQTLNYVSDYYNANHSAASKAALAAQLFGRGYADLIPVLKLGSAGIREVGVEAAKLGLHLTQSNVTDLVKYRETMRELGDAVGGLQLQIGLALLPAVKGLASSLTEFISSHRDDIVKFFKDAAHFAGEVGDALSKYVVPGFQAIASAWSALPEGLKAALITGFVANKAVGLFGTSLKGLASGAGDIASEFLKRGSPANPMFTKDIGGLGGVGGAAGSGILGTVASVAQKVFIVGLAAEAADLIHGAISPGGGLEGRTNGLGGGLLPADQLSWPFGPKNTPHVDLGPIKNIFGGDSAFTTPPPPVSGITGGGGGSGFGGGSSAGGGGGIGSTGSSIGNWNSVLAGLNSNGKAAAAGLISFGAASRKAAADLRGANIAHVLLSEIGGLKGVAARSAKKFGGTGLGAAAVQATYDRDVARRIDGVLHSGRTVETKLATLQAIAKQVGKDGDAKTRSLLSKDIKNLQGQVKKQKPPSVSVTVGTSVQVSANSVISKYSQTRTYGPSDPQHKSHGIYEP